MAEGCHPPRTLPAEGDLHLGWPDEACPPRRQISDEGRPSALLAKVAFVST